jgi:hypothetical protein
MARPPKPDPLDRHTGRRKPHEHGVILLWPDGSIWSPATFGERAAATYEEHVASMRAWRAGEVPVAVRLVRNGAVMAEERFRVDWPGQTRER